MENLKEFFEKQLTIKKELKFNIFSVLHDEKDEERLHSRFIAYLLSSKTSHGMKNKFLKSFVQEVLHIPDFDCENCLVETEYKDIDILIYNSEEAILIENKIYAGDSNHLERDDDGYKWQLERYYNTIIQGKDKDGNDSLKRNVTKVIYLTLDGREPKETRGKIPVEKIKSISYNSNEDKKRTDNVKNWLRNCIKIVENQNELFGKILYQYQELITNLTSNVGQAKENQREISKNIDDAWELENGNMFFTKECHEIFKHIKWHVVADFINELEIALIEKGAEIIEKPNLEEITKVTHNKNNNANTRIVTRFWYKNCDLYIANDRKNGFTLGNLTNRKWDYFSKEIKNIKFCDFSGEKTFCIINEEKRNEIINKIIKELQEERYENLKQIF